MTKISLKFVIDCFLTAMEDFVTLLRYLLQRYIPEQETQVYRTMVKTTQVERNESGVKETAH